MADQLQDVLTRTKPATAAPVQPRSARPIIGWASVGTAVLTFEIYLMTNWVVSGNFSSTAPGPTPVPGWMSLVIRAWEFLSLPMLGAFLYYFLVRPWRRQGHITTDGLLCLVFLTIFWQEPVMNWFSPYYTYNAAFTNFGSWVTGIPGWISPRTNQLAFPLFWATSVYVYAMFGVAVLGCAFMRWTSRRNPACGVFRLLLHTFAFFVVVDLIVDPLGLLLGLYTFPGAKRGLTLFAGHYYQLPIYEVLAAAAIYTAWASIRFFHNDRGESLAERGLHALSTSGRRTTLIRFLALTGICNVAMFCCYTLPLTFIAASPDPWPQDILRRSYFTDGICGPGTTYACPGPEVPLPRPGSLHVSPDGRLVDRDGRVAVH